jgi:hypothetical protein
LTALYAEPVDWQRAYAKHPFVVRAAVTAQYRSEWEKPKPTPSRSPLFLDPHPTCPGGHRPWSCL